MNYTLVVLQYLHICIEYNIKSYFIYYNFNYCKYGITKEMHEMVYKQNYLWWNLSYPDPLGPGVVHKFEKSVSLKLCINSMKNIILV